MYTAEDFARALQQLLPPGAAFDWQRVPQGLGSELLRGWGVELARAANRADDLAVLAIHTHTPSTQGRSLADYQRLLDQTYPGDFRIEAQWAKPFRAGSAAGDRVWPLSITLVLRVLWAKSTDGVAVTRPTSLLEALAKLFDPIRPAHVRLWGWP